MMAPRTLLMASEAVVVLAIAAHILIPSNVTVEASRSPVSSVAVPLYWLVPLVLITVSGIVSAMALLRLYWL